MPRSGGIGTAESLRIETFEGGGSRLRRTRQRAALSFLIRRTPSTPFQAPVRRATIRALSRVVEDNPDGVPHAGSNTAHAVAEIYAIVALRPLYRTVMDGKGYGITLPKWHNLRRALHARPLFS